MKILLAFLAGCTLLIAQGRAVAQAGEAKARDQPVGQLNTCCQKIARDIQRIYYLHNRSGKVRLIVRGIYTRGKSLFFSLRLINRSSLAYDVDSVRFFITERKRKARFIQRVRELVPLYVYDSITSVQGYGRSAGIYVIPRLTLSRHRRLEIDVREKNGGRHLQIHAANFTLETAKLI